MESHYIYIPILLSLLITTTTALPQINSISVLVAVLDQRYTISELIEKTLLLHALEHAITQHNLTIFAPNNEANTTNQGIVFVEWNEILVVVAIQLLNKSVVLIFLLLFV